MKAKGPSAPFIYQEFRAVAKVKSLVKLDKKSMTKVYEKTKV